MTDTSHLVALHTNLCNSKARLATAKGSEIAIRTVWVAQLEKEIAGELAFLGLTSGTVEMSDDDLLAELTA